MSILHDTDFYSWTQQQSALLRTANFAALDVTNLIEEIEDMGRSEKRELENRLIVLLVHLLKWQYQPGLRSVSWEVTIRRQRIDIKDHLLDNPGLQSILYTSFARAYPKARLDARGETMLPLNVVPISCLWTFNQVIDDDFWPE